MTHKASLLCRWVCGAFILLITAKDFPIFAEDQGLAPLLKKGYVRVCADAANLPFSSEKNAKTPGF